MSKYDIYSLGNALVDLEFEVTEEELKTLGVEKSLMTLIDEDQHHQLIDDLDGFKHAKACGGSGANSIAAAQVLGAKAFFTCRVANDVAGEFFHNDFNAKGVKTNLDTNGHVDGITGKCIVMLTPDAERTMCTFLGVADKYTEDDIDVDALKNSKYLYSEGYAVASEASRKAVARAQEIAKENDIITATSLSDPNMVRFFRDELIEMMKGKSDLIFANREEALLFCQTDDIKEAQETMKKYAKTFAITLGKEGSVAFDGENMHYCERYSTELVDTLGAGDTFAGAFLYALAQGYNYMEASHLANVAGGVIVAKHGPRISEEDAGIILDTAKGRLATAS